MKNMVVLGIVGWSGSGKTTLIEALIPILKRASLKLGVIKQTHHTVVLDQQGKDSARHYAAGADKVLLAHPKGGALFIQTEMSLIEQLRCFEDCDLVLVEGHKSADIPKIEVYRPSLGHAVLAQADANIMAIASDEMLRQESTLKQLDLNNVMEIATTILVWFENKSKETCL